MFTNFTNYKIVNNTKGAKTFAKVGGIKPTKTSLVTAVSRHAEKPAEAAHKETAFYANNYNTSVYPQHINFTSPISPQQNFTTFLESFVNTNDHANLRLKYRDLYYFDNICGTAVDLRSELPFSDYTLTGISDPAVLQVYSDALEEVKPLQFLRRLLADYFVYGASAYWLLFDDERKIFASPLPLDLDRCTLIQTPLLNDAPFINYQMDESLNTFIGEYNNGDVRVQEYVKQRPALLKLIAAAGGDNGGSKTQSIIKLEPEFTLYLERNDLSYSPKASVSYFSRVLKYYEYEKRIFRGTIDMAEKRLKSILHLSIGSDTILPNAETLAEISNAFKTANLDPTDAIVATHNYVSTNEIRQPTDFWRWDEVSDFINRGKMVALGINEQFLSGEMSYASMESALSVFLEQLLWDRTYVTDKVFYKTLFPYIAKQNGFISKDKDVTASYESHGKDIGLGPLMQYKNKNTHKERYEIPTIAWHKALKPKVDKDWLATLTELKDQGIPIPYRMWLTGAGINVDELMSEYGVDKSEAIETKAAEYKDRFEVHDDYSGQFGDEDFTAAEDAGNIEEDLFAQDFEEPTSEVEEEKLSSEPTTTPEAPNKAEAPSNKDNPQLFQGASMTPIGLKNRMKLGDLNSEEVQAKLTPTITDPYGKKRQATAREVKILDEQANKILATQLAQKDQKEQMMQKQQYTSQRERATSYIS